MFETYRMLGKQREVELLREAQRLHAGQAVKRHAGQAVKEGRVLTPGRRLVSVVRSRTVVLLIRLRGSTTRAAKKPPAPQLDP